MDWLKEQFLIVMRGLITLAALWFCVVDARVVAQVPQRVVSMNLCTDQLAMLLADPNQLISISYLASDPYSSAMIEKAKRFKKNFGQAEDIALLRPDLVLAGSFSSRTTVNMLERLGYDVLIFEPDQTVADLIKNLRKMGQALGQAERAEALIAQVQSDLTDLDRSEDFVRKRAALYYSGGYMPGNSAFSSDILAHIGLGNIAEELGVPYGGSVSLEALIIANPEVVVRGQNYSGHSLAEEMLEHPALNHMLTRDKIKLQTSPEWNCATPYTIAMMQQLATIVQNSEAVE